MKNHKIRFSLSFKAVIIIISLSVVLCAIALIMSYFRFSATNEENFKEHADDIAHTAAVSINANDMKVVHDSVIKTFRSIPENEIVLSDDWGSPEHDKYMEHFAWIEDLPEYKSVYETFERLQSIDSETFSSIYSMTYDTSKEMDYALYLVDASEEDACPAGLTEHAEDADFSQAYDPEAGEPYLTDMDIYGWLVTANAPVYDENGECVGFVGVDLSMDDIKSVESRFMLILSIIMIGATIIICVIVLLLINRTVIRPLKKLSLVAMEYTDEKENRERFESIQMSRSDEIGSLSDAMKKMEKDIGNYITDITSMTAEKERINAELSIAAKLQSDMLPKDFKISDKLSLYATMNPAREIGGDFYDFLPIDNDHVGIVMADVSGKGVSAAMFMVITRTLLKIRTTAPGTPSEILYDINNTLIKDNPANLFVTVWFGVLTLSTGTLIYSNAGHEFPAIKRAGSEYSIKKVENMPPLALEENIQYEDETLELKSGDGIFLYTDGVPDAKRSDGTRFGLDNMLSVLQQEKNSSPEELVIRMKKEIEAFTGGADPFDDITMMSLTFE